MTYSLPEIQAAWQNTTNPLILRQFIGNPELGHQVHDMSAHAGHEMVAEGGVSGAGEMALMAHKMGHGAGMSMEGMLQDMRNRFLVTFVLAIPVFLYSPLFTDTFGIQLPLSFGLSNEVLSFLLATPAV